MKIGVDLDDVLIDLNRSLSLFHNAKFGTTYDIEDVRSFELEKVWNCTTEEMIRRVNIFYKIHRPHRIMTIDGAVETLNRLKNKNELVVITGRPPSVAGKTEETIAYHFPNIFKDIYYTNFFSKREQAVTKADICQQKSIDIFIEDNFEWANQIAEKGIPVLLLDAPWNQLPINNPKIARVHNWKEIEQKIEKK